MSTANSKSIYNNQNKFYVYLHIDPRNNEVFYVGKGHAERSRDFDKTSRSKQHFNKLNKLHKKLKYPKDDIR